MAEGITFGGWLRQRRKEQGLTYEELADRIGCSRITLIKIENGERHPSAQIALLLADYLKVPSDERQAFVAFARTGRQVSGEASSTAPWRNALVRQTNLPALLTPIIGREQEKAATLDHLLNPKTRLLTLIGAPGIGKTRLGLQVAFDLLANFEDGVYFVDLAPVMDPELVLPVIARTFGLQETVAQPLENLLLDYIRQKRMLLLLDNFEQVLDASTEVARLLEASPWLKVLITSREALQIRGERRFLVPPLAVPDLDSLPSPDKLVSCPSVELFVERAQSIASDFTLVEANAGDVAAVCVGLEGLPLAIELAASRANWLSPAKMRVALASRLKLLRAETRDLPARQRTLRGAIEWSYDLLASEEQMLFRKLGVFVGGFTSDAVDLVCGGGDEGRRAKDEGSASSFVLRPSSAKQALETLQSLVDKSLVKRDSLGSTDGETRFGMLEAIREYVGEKLEESEQPREIEEVERRHALYFMQVAEKAEPHLTGAAQVGWLDRLEREHDNLRAAIQWASISLSVAKEDAGEGENGNDNADGGNTRQEEAAEMGLRTVAALWRFWQRRGYVSEGREQTATVLTASTSQSWPTSAPLQIYKARALNGAGSLAYAQGDYASALSLFEQCLAIHQERGDEEGIANVLVNLGNVAHEQGDTTSARDFYERSLALLGERGDKMVISRLLLNLGIVAHEQGDYASARSLYEQSLVIRQELGDKESIANALTYLGDLADEEGDSDTARSMFERSLALRREVGNMVGISDNLGFLARLAYEKGDYASALSIYSEGLSIRQRAGDKVRVASSLHELANVACAQGDYALARRLYNESLSIKWEIRTTIRIPNSLVGLGWLAAKTSEPRRAAILLGTGSALWEAIGYAPEREARRQYEECMTSAQAELGEEAFTIAWTEGRAMPLEEAISYAQQDSNVSSRMSL